MTKIKEILDSHGPMSVVELREPYMVISYRILYSGGDSTDYHEDFGVFDSGSWKRFSKNTAASGNKLIKITPVSKKGYGWFVRWFLRTCDKEDEIHGESPVASFDSSPNKVVNGYGTRDEYNSR